MFLPLAWETDSRELDHEGKGARVDEGGVVHEKGSQTAVTLGRDSFAG